MRTLVLQPDVEIFQGGRAAESDPLFTISDSSALKKQLLIFYLYPRSVAREAELRALTADQNAYAWNSRLFGEFQAYFRGVTD